ncbi:MAG: tryptophan dimethylallyltransferase, partial [Proteobacteria bacterium]
LVPSAPHYKAYLNPRVGEPGSSFALASESLARLGLQAAVPTLHSARQSPDDDVRYFGIDLKRTEKSRVKVYLYQPGATTAYYERLAGMAPRYRAGEATALCRALTGFDGPYTRHPLCTYLSFVEGSDRPYEVTIQVPIRFYCPDDQIARSRVLAFLESRRLDPQPYDDALYALARRPLSRGSGLQTYVSLRLGEATPRVAVYLAVEAYAVDERRASGVRRAT